LIGATRFTCTTSSSADILEKALDIALEKRDLKDKLERYKSATPGVGVRADTPASTLVDTHCDEGKRLDA
jgi:hypothetical protein